MFQLLNQSGTLYIVDPATNGKAYQVTAPSARHFDDDCYDLSLGNTPANSTVTSTTTPIGATTVATWYGKGAFELVITPTGTAATYLAHGQVDEEITQGDTLQIVFGATRSEPEEDTDETSSDEDELVLATMGGDAITA